MKKAILLANIGNSDLGDGKDLVFSQKNTSFTGNVYEDSKKIWDSKFFENFNLPILDPTIKKISESFDIQEIILFGTDQDTHKEQDTIYIALIASEILYKRYKGEINVKVSPIFENPTNYKGLIRFYQQFSRSISDSVEQIFVSTTGATPQLNLSLMLQISRKFGEKVKIIYKSRHENEALVSDTIFEERKEVARIGVAQISFDLTETFPPKVKDKKTTNEKIFKFLDIAANEKVNIVCLPELCMCDEWLDEIERRYSNMTIIAGSLYDEEGHNVCHVITDSDRNILLPQFKIKPSDFENSIVCGLGMVPGKKINIYDETLFGKFVVLICKDFGDLCSEYKSRLDIDFLFVPSFNSANRRFHELAHNHVENSLSYVIISNTAKNGGTAIFGRMKDSFFPGLVSKGFKQKDDPTFKLCELKEGIEGMIIANFNLVHKFFPTPTPLSPDVMSPPVWDIKVVDIEGKNLEGKDLNGIKSRKKKIIKEAIRK
jgi:predicted amidohydrolase